MRACGGIARPLSRQYLTRCCSTAYTTPLRFYHVRVLAEELHSAPRRRSRHRTARAASRRYASHSHHCTGATARPARPWTMRRRLHPATAQTPSSLSLQCRLCPASSLPSLPQVHEQSLPHMQPAPQLPAQQARARSEPHHAHRGGGGQAHTGDVRSVCARQCACGVAGPLCLCSAFDCCPPSPVRLRRRSWVRTCRRRRTRSPRCTDSSARARHPPLRCTSSPRRTYSHRRTHPRHGSCSLWRTEGDTHTRRGDTRD